MPESLAQNSVKTMPTIVMVPIPPSVNALWRAARGRVHRSRRYVAWLQAAGWELKLQRPRKILGPVAISIAAGRPDRRKRDLDNFCGGKAVLDLLVHHQVIQDDSMVASLAARWDTAIPPGRIAITIAAAN